MDCLRVEIPDEVEQGKISEINESHGQVKDSNCFSVAGSTVFVERGNF